MIVTWAAYQQSGRRWWDQKELPLRANQPTPQQSYPKRPLWLVRTSTSPRLRARRRARCRRSLACGACGAVVHDSSEHHDSIRKDKCITVERDPQSRPATCTTPTPERPGPLLPCGAFGESGHPPHDHQPNLAYPATIAGALPILNIDQPSLQFQPLRGLNVHEQAWLARGSLNKLALGDRNPQFRAVASGALLRAR